MVSSYQTLFTIAFRHDYFLNNRFRGFTFTPLQETFEYMSRRGLLLKVMGAEIKVLAETGADAELKLKQLYAENYNLKFAVNITDGNFFNYTDGLDGDAANTVYYFSNVNREGGARNNSKLNQDETTGTHDARPVTEFSGLFFAKPFAIVDIRLLAENPAEFQISFRAKSTYWKYIIISSQFHDYENLSIVGGQDISFDGPEEMDLQNRQRAMVFQSKELIKLSEKPSKTFSLVENYVPGTNRHRVLKRILPAPDIGAISAATLTNMQTNYSEIFI